MLQIKQHSVVQHSPGCASDDSENAPLLRYTRAPGKIIPDRLEVTFGYKTSRVISNKENYCTQNASSESTRTQGSVKIPVEYNSGRNYSPHTITLDTDNRKNTVLRKKRPSHHYRNKTV